MAVRIAIAGATLTASVADQGPGFDPAKTRGVGPDGGQGLKGLRDRAESLGGALEIDSTPGRGTRLTLMLPIEAGETP